MTKRSAIVTATAVLAVGAGAAAWAANGWTVDGKGTASAEGAEIKALNAHAAVVDKLYPGVVTKISLTVDNPNEFPVILDKAITPTKFTVDPATPKCEQGLLTAVKSTDFPGTPTVQAKKSATVESNLTIGELPQDCAAKKIQLEYTFKAVSTVK
ncbi:hypothetical protein ACFY36_22615 [Actinoplanes sp. NPDC000266]